MRTIKHTVDGCEAVIFVPETPGDMSGFREWIATTPVVAIDTETTGLDTTREGGTGELMLQG